MADHLTNDPRHAAAGLRRRRTRVAGAAAGYVRAGSGQAHRPQPATTRLRSALWVPLFGDLADPVVVARLAAEAEEAGWHGFFVWDHLCWRGPGGPGAHSRVPPAGGATASRPPPAGPPRAPPAPPPAGHGT